MEDEIWVKNRLVVSKLGEHPPQMETISLEPYIIATAEMCPLEMRFLLAHFQQSHRANTIKGMNPEEVSNCNPAPIKYPGRTLSP